MSDLLFLCRSAGGLLPAWFLLTITSALLEFVAINSILPVIWEGDSVIRDVARSAYAQIGVADENMLPATILFVAAAYVGRNVFLTLQSALSARITTAMQVDVKLRLLGRIDNAGYYPISTMNMGVLGNAVLRETGNISMAMGNLVNAACHGIFATALFILAVMLEPWLITAGLIIVIPCYFGMSKVISFSKRISEEQTRNYGRIQSLLVQTLAALKYAKNTETGGRITNVMSADIRRQGRLLLVQQCFAYALHNGTDLILVLMALGGVFVYAGPMGQPVIGIIFILFVFRRSVSYAVACQGAFRQYLELHGSVKIVQDLDRELSEYAITVNPDAVPPDFSQPIHVEGVSFRYPTSAAVLRNVSLTIPAGGKVALVGASGSGKSTLVMLLTGALQPGSGGVSLGRTPYRELDLARLRSQTGYVSQESIVFNDTVINNVTLWDPEPSPDRVERALASAEARDFVNELPDNWETPVGDDGNALSGGERQRIAIARELYKNGKLLILDEATSGLDGGVELSILQNIRAMTKDTTVIAITHRIAAARQFDMICVLENGEIVEQGPYDKLHRANGIFRAMAAAQGL